MAKRKIGKVKLCSMVEDFDIYPRNRVDSTNVSQLVHSMEGGADIPPIILDAKSKRIIDGFHRKRAYEKIYEPEEEIECELVTTKGEKEIVLMAINLNSSHGLKLTAQDKGRCVQLAKQFDIEMEALSNALNLTVDIVEHAKELLAPMVNSKGKKVGEIVKKSPVKHVKTFRKEQQEDLKKVGGMKFGWNANQLLIAIRNEWLDMENDKLIETLRELKDSLNAIFDGRAKRMKKA